MVESAFRHGEHRHVSNKSGLCHLPEPKPPKKTSGNLGKVGDVGVKRDLQIRSCAVDSGETVGMAMVKQACGYTEIIIPIYGRNL